MDRRRLVNEYLDRRLPPERRAAFEAQLGEDAQLATELAEAQRTLTLLRNLDEELAPAYVLPNIMAAVHGRPVPRRRAAVLVLLNSLRQPRRLMLAAATAAVLAFAGFLAKPEQVQLTTADEAFIRQCLADYHVEMSRRLATGNSGGSADLLSETGLEF